MIQENRPPVVGRYNIRQTSTEEHGRGIKATDQEWQTEKEISLPGYDAALAEQIELAIARGDTQLVVVDIGCGREGLIEDSINNSHLLQKTSALLKAHPEFKIRFLGLLDAKKPEEFGTHTTLFNKATPNLSAETYKYTLTTQQTVADFLNGVEVQQVGLILATWSLAYMGGNTFQKVLEDSLAALVPQGKMLVHGYLNKHPGYGMYNRIPKLDTRGINKDSEDWQQLLKKIVNGELWRDGSSFETFLKSLTEVESHFKNLPEFKNEAYLEKKAKILSQKPKLTFIQKIILGEQGVAEKMKSVRLRLESLFNMTMRSVGWRKTFELSQDKLAVLKRFIEQHSEEMVVEHTADSILLQKK